jgi:hypothetical protein
VRYQERRAAHISAAAVVPRSGTGIGYHTAPYVDIIRKRAAPDLSILAAHEKPPRTQAGVEAMSDKF